MSRGTEDGKDEGKVRLEGASGEERQDLDEGDGVMTDRGDREHKGEDQEEDMTEGLWVAI